jgi:hypothetical protein
LYFAGQGGFGILLPLGVQVGIHPSKLVAIALGFDVDLALSVGFQGGFAAGIPILFGPGVEFNATPNLAITFNLRLGPGIGVVAGGTNSGREGARAAWSFCERRSGKNPSPRARSIVEVSPTHGMRSNASTASAGDFPFAPSGSFERGPEKVVQVSAMTMRCLPP